MAKQYGIKSRCYGELLKEHLEKLIGTPWEHIGNRQQMKNKKHMPPLKTQKKKTKPTYDIICTMKELV
jgi:hypothetical protein